MVTTFRYSTVERVDGRTQSVWSQVVPNPLWCSRCSLLTRYWLATNSLLWCAAAAVSHVAAVAAWRACLRLLTNNWSNRVTTCFICHVFFGKFSALVMFLENRVPHKLLLAHSALSFLKRFFFITCQISFVMSFVSS